MSEFRIRRADLLKTPVCNTKFIELFDARVAEQGLDPHDLVFPDGWTELHSIALYKTGGVGAENAGPIIHKFLMQFGLIPQDKVAAAFPRYLCGQTLFDYVLPKLPSEMTPEDFQNVLNQ